MNLQQFRFVRETIRRNFNLTEAAKSLYTSQPGVSKAIMEFEQELGVQIFERHGKRIKGLTRPGQAVAEVVERINREIENLRKVSDEYARRDQGSLIIACTHTQARYALPKVIPAFRAQFPKVHLSLAEGSPTQSAELVLSGDADVAIATESLAQTPGLASVACYHWEHSVVCKPEHPLIETYSRKGVISLSDLAEYPIVTYDPAFSGRRNIDDAFAQAGLSPDIVLAAVDADVIKTYVDVDLGIGIIASMAYDPLQDDHLCSIPAGHLFGRQTTRVAVKAGEFLRDYVYTFIGMMAPDLDESEIKQQIGSAGMTNVR
ncbi:CysB family HTH-type transcriptional regulator [Orrella marina]|uniref:Transcriptional regulator n=1 Tax=Orrella marina TaxID=2163011 RepID=A0A2R4XJ03_9BURK|nr:CysB family HTH-type transcriptional regulator [Orrella marina]AWB33765.1 transcriptional regulator [Orrella marina]